MPKPSAVMPQQCKTCIFRQDGEQLSLAPGRLAEIQSYLIEGTPHRCHTVDAKVCRGGRDYQLTCWHRMGLIPEPTDAALANTMSQMGLEPPPENEP